MSKRILKYIWWIIGIVVLILLLISPKLFPQKVAQTIADPSALPGIQTGDAPWTAEISQLSQRLRTIGLPALSQEGVALHIHQHLDVYVDGKPISVPGGIGINQGANYISDIHTHDNSSVIHVESPTRQTFTLGQLFDVWGVKLTEDSIGGYIASGDKALKVYSNGKLYEGDPRELPLEQHQEIVVTYGTDQELPNPIPSSFSFGANL